MRRTFKRNKVVVAAIDEQWDVDLMDMSRLSKYNDGYAYVLVAIDIMSRYTWLRPLKNKTGKVVAEGFESIFEDGRRPVRIRSDKGQEFKAKVVQNMFERVGIHHFVTQNEPKANYAERVIKTIKSKIYRYFTFKQTYKYVDQLQNFADSYNGTKHRSIGMEPKQVDQDDETKIWWKMYWPKVGKVIKKEAKQTKVAQKPFRFKLGSHVRMTHLRNPFTREYDQRWTGEIFKIAQRFLRGGLPIYRLEDMQGKEIQGSFYQPELQRVEIKEDAMWKVDKILKSRQRRGQDKEYLVKWLDWPSQFNSWVKASDIEDV
jgi:hypothetical protein